MDPDVTIGIKPPATQTVPLPMIVPLKHDDMLALDIVVIEELSLSRSDPITTTEQCSFWQSLASFHDVENIFHPPVPVKCPSWA